MYVLSYVVQIMITYNLLPNNKLVKDNKIKAVILYNFTQQSKINIRQF